MASTRRLRSVLRRVRSAIGRSPEPMEDGPDEDEAPAEPQDPVDRAIEADVVDLDIEDIRLLLESDRLDAHRLAIGWIVALPSMSRDEAETLVAVLVRNLDHGDHFKKRIAIRGLRAVYELQPDVTTAEFEAIVGGLADYHASVRQEAIQTVARILADRPALAGAVYPLLDSGTPDHRETALEALVETAGSRPEIVDPIAPAIAREVDRDEVSGPLLARAVGILAANDPECHEGLVASVLEWLPTDQPDVDTAVVGAIVERAEWSPDLLEEMVPIVLEWVAETDAPDSAVASWLGTVLEDDDVAEPVRTWAADRPRAARRRVAARIDEATGTVDRFLLDWLSLADDPVLSARFDD